MQQSVSVKTTWRVHLTDQSWGILKCYGTKTLARFYFFIYVNWKEILDKYAGVKLLFAVHLVLAVVIRLQMLHMKPVIWRTDSTKVESVTNLKGDLFIKSKTNRLFLKEHWPVWINIKWSEWKTHLEKAAQSFIDNHLDTFNLMRKHIWKVQGWNQIRIITTNDYNTKLSEISGFLFFSL